MKKFYFSFGIALATFLLGISAALYFRQAGAVSPAPVTAPPAPVRPLPATPPPSCSRAVPSEKRLEAAAAVRVAECFVIRNGYTDLPPAADNSELTPEYIGPGTDEEGMELRRDSLERTAFGYAKVSDGWLVVFRSKYKAEYAGAVPDYEEWLKTHGRAVSMDAYGGRLRVVHEDVDLSQPGLKKLSTGVRAGN